MWTRKELKEKGKFTFKRNYWKTVLISLILAAFVGGGVSSTSGFHFNDGSDQDEEMIESFVEQAESGEFTGEHAKELQDLANQLEGIENTLNHLSGPALAGFIAGVIVVVVIAVAVALAVIITIEAFVVNPLLLGARRFFLTNLNAEAEVKEIAYGFDHNYKNNVKTLFFRDLYIVLWSLLFIIPGIVKAYEYRMIAYLLAENPSLTKEEAFALSKQMMNGQKWNAFVLDLSFIGWRILGGLTLGILNIFYVSPYKNMTDAALYEVLRNNQMLVSTPASQEELAQ